MAAKQILNSGTPVEATLTTQGRGHWITAVGAVSAVEILAGDSSTWVAVASIASLTDQAAFLEGTPSGLKIRATGTGSAWVTE